MKVYGVFPRRGGQAGGYEINIYGVNFQKGTPSVYLGTRRCLVVSVIGSGRIVCKVLGGIGTANVVVRIGKEVSTFSGGFRFISGKSEPLY